MGIPQAATACSRTARRGFAATDRDLGRIGRIGLDNTEFAGILTVTLLADELAVVDPVLVANPLRGAGAATTWRGSLLGLLIAFALVLTFATVLATAPIPVV